MAEVKLKVRDGNGAVVEVRYHEDAEGVLTPIHQIEAPSGGLPVQLSGSNQDLRGSLAERPAAGPEHKGKTFWDVDNPVDVYVCDGTTWTLL